MSFASTAAVLDSMKTRIEALAPAAVVNEDDKFRVFLEEIEAILGSRTIELTAQGAVKVRPGLTCPDWQTDVTLILLYVSTPSEVGEQTVHQKALRDSEDILNDLYTWAGTTTGILRMTPSPASVNDNGQGVIEATRQISIEFRRT